MSVLKTIQQGLAHKPPRILIYGTEGIGKTTSASQAPKPIFVQTEDGHDQIATDRFPLAKSYDDVYAALKDLHDEPHDYETVVVDSLDWLERLIFDRLCDQYGVASIEKVDGGYGKGYTHALSIWREFITQLDALRRDRGMVVILIAHSKFERFEDPESTPYDRYSPRLYRHASALVCEWCDAVLCATRKMRVQSEDAGFNRKRSIAHPIGKAGGDRILRCVGGPSCVAKRGRGQEPKIRDIPPAILETAQWWEKFRPGTGNLVDWNPTPAIVPIDDAAARLLVDARVDAERQYDKAEEANDSVGTTVWGRVSEQARKLALLHAVSRNCRDPVIDAESLRRRGDSLRPERQRHEAAGKITREVGRAGRKFFATDPPHGHARRFAWATFSDGPASRDAHGRPSQRNGSKMLTDSNSSLMWTDDSAGPK